MIDRYNNQRQVIRTAKKLYSFPTFEERYRYLRLGGSVGHSTFGYDRYLNQMLYKTKEWRRARDEAILRDSNGDYVCDLGVEGYEIHGRIIVHHMNPITVEDIELMRPCLFDVHGLVCTSQNTHEAIHFSDESLLPRLPVERRPNDTRLWPTNSLMQINQNERNLQK